MNNFDKKDAVLYRFIRNYDDSKLHKQIEETSGICKDVITYEDTYKENDYVERPNLTKVLVHFNSVGYNKSKILMIANIFDLESSPLLIQSIVKGLKINNIKLFDLNNLIEVDSDQLINFLSELDSLLQTDNHARREKTIQQVFNDHIINGMSYSQLADKYNISSRTAMKYVKEVRNMK